MKSRLFPLLVTLAGALCFSITEATPATSSRILYLLQAGQCSTALGLYREQIALTGSHDRELLQQIGISLLEQGYRTRDPEIQFLVLYGAGIALNQQVLYLLEEGIKSPEPLLQLVALNFLSRYQDDSADEAINRAMSSNSLLIRFEGALRLAEKRAPNAVGQTEALMCKVPPVLLPLFPQIYAMAGTKNAIKELRKLLVNPDEKVRVASILSVAKYRRDDLLPLIRTLSAHHATAQQEAVAYALGELRDEDSAPKLQELALNKTPSVRLAALYALYQLGREEMRLPIEAMAKAQDLFAITLLGEMHETVPVLEELIKSENNQVRLNAAIALLKQKEVRCLPVLVELLIRDSRDLALTLTSSLGTTLKAFKVVPCATQNFENDPSQIEHSLALREELLERAAELPEENFLQLARSILESRQSDLVPSLAGLLEKMHSPAATGLLEQYQQKMGAPLIRNYCTLVLFHQNREGPYRENLLSWMDKQQKEEILFRPLVSREMTDLGSSFQLTPREASQLFLEALEVLAEKDENLCLDLLLNAIQYGHRKNKYTLAGVLIRVAQS